MHTFIQNPVRGPAFLGVVVMVFGGRAALAQEAAQSQKIVHSRTIELYHTPGVVVAKISRDGSIVAAASERMLAVFDLARGHELGLWDFEGDLVDVDLSADGRFVAAATNSPIINVFDTKDVDSDPVHELHRRDGPSFLRNDGQVRVSFFPEGSKLVSSGGRRRIYLSDVNTGLWDHIAFVKYSSAPTPIVSPDGKYVALIGAPNASELSGHVTMLKVRRGLQPLWNKLHEGKLPVTHGSFSSDSSRLVTCGNGDGVRVWNVESGEQVAHITNESGGVLIGASITNEESDLVLTVSPARIFLQRISTGEELQVVPAPKEQRIKGFSTSDQGSFVTFTGAAIDVWQLKTQR